jgi:glycosyltransferase involved in cell wall biosynthesis
MQMPWAWPQDVGLVIPAYQAAGYLASTLKTVLAWVPASHVIVVDDGSTDSTSSVARGLGVEVKRHTVNRGKGSALATGLLAMYRRGYPFTVTMDSDGQHDPADLARFMARAPAADVAIVVGARPVGGTDMPWHRRFSNITTTFLVSLLAGQQVYDAQSGYRMYRTELMARKVWPEDGRFEWEAQALILCRRAGYRIESVPIATVYGEHGSHMRLIHDTLRFLRMMGKLAWMR